MFFNFRLCLKVAEEPSYKLPASLYHSMQLETTRKKLEFKSGKGSLPDYTFLLPSPRPPKAWDVEDHPIVHCRTLCLALTKLFLCHCASTLSTTLKTSQLYRDHSLKLMKWEYCVLLQPVVLISLFKPLLHVKSNRQSQDVNGGYVEQQMT